MEITANATQTVSAGSNVLFTSTSVKGSCSILYTDGSGLVALRGLTNQRRALFKVNFHCNMGVPSGGSPAAIQISIANNGEIVNATTMISVPAAAGTLQNVGTTTYIIVPKGATSQISIKNTSSVPISVANANLIVERVA